MLGRYSRLGRLVQQRDLGDVTGRVKITPPITLRAGEKLACAWEDPRHGWQIRWVSIVHDTTFDTAAPAGPSSVLPVSLGETITGAITPRTP